MDTNDKMQEPTVMDNASDDTFSSSLSSINSAVSAKTIADRRAALRLGLAGMPMMLTLRASANSGYVSQLRCTYIIECGYIALVDGEGAVWLGNPGWGSIPDLTASVIEDFKDDAIAAYPAGTAPNEYLPNTSECDPCTGADPVEDYGKGKGGSSDDDDDSGGKKGKKGKGDDDDDDSWGSSGDSCSSGSSSSYGDDDDDSGGKKGKSDDDDDSGGGFGSGDEATYNCAYTIVEFPCNDTFTIGDALSVSGDVTTGGLRGFWLELATSYVEAHGPGDFPGVSCLVSVLSAAGRM